MTTLIFVIYYSAKAWISLHSAKLSECARATCRTFGVPVDEWDDVAQSYLLHVFANVLPKYRFGEWQSVAYSHTTRKRFVIDYLRKLRPGSMLPLEDAQAPVTSGESIEKRAELASLISQLPEPYRFTMTVFLQEPTAEKAARTLGIKIEAYRQRIKRAQAAMMLLAQGESPKPRKAKRA